MIYKKKILDKNNQLKNKNRKPHTYGIRDKVLVCNKKANNYENPYVGTYPITQVWTNVNVTTCWGSTRDRINIIWIKLYKK